MLKQNLEIHSINASNLEEVQQIHAFKPLLTGGENLWRGIHFFHQLVVMGETVAATADQHLLIVPLGECVVDRWLDSKLQHEHQSGGDCFLVPQGVTHRAYKYMDVESIAIVIEPGFLNQIAIETFDQPSVELIPRFCHADPLILQLALALKQDLAVGCPTGHLYGESLATALVAHLIRHNSVLARASKHYAGKLSLLQLQQMKDYIDAHLIAGISLAAIAQHLDISQYYLIRLFKQSTGVTPHQYVMQRRLQVAKQLLANSELSITQISNSLGFSDLSQFSHFFRKQVGVSPKTYRQAK